MELWQAFRLCKCVSCSMQCAQSSLHVPEEIGALLSVLALAAGVVRRLRALHGHVAPAHGVGTVEQDAAASYQEVHAAGATC